VNTPHGTKHPDLWAALAAPFRRDLVQTRDYDGRRYVKAQAVQARLDEVLGPENWWPAYEGWSEDAVVCRLSVRLPDGSVVTKSDVGAYSSMSDKMAARGKSSDPGDDDKGGFSDALKRAAVAFGVARYLYDPGFFPSYLTTEAYRHPASAEPIGPEAESTRPGPGPSAEAGPLPRTNVNGKAHDGPPRNGKQLYAWTKDREQEYDVRLLQYMNQWGRLQEYPGRMVDWNADQTERAFAEASRKLANLGQAEGVAG
jgi:hypothetical protein